MNKVVLSSIIDIISGGTPQTSVEEYWNNGNIGWLSVTDFNNDLRYVYASEKKITERGLKESNTKLLQYSDIIISARGTVGALAQIGKPMCFNQSCFGIRGKKDKVDNDFLYYALKNYVQHIKKRSQGSVFDTINLKSFDLMEIEIPKSIIEQEKIAKVLSDLDSKIELNNKINAELEEMSKNLYDYWFVQFDFPEANGKPYKTSGGEMAWNEDLKREIPVGWEVKILNSVIETILDHRGKTPKKLGGDWTDDENGIIALSAKIVKGGKLDNLNQANKVSRELYDKWMQVKLADGDILMTSEAPAGEFYFIQGKTDYCMSQRLFGIRANQSKMVPSYLYYELSKGNGYSQIMGSLSGSTVFGIRQDVLRKILVIVPNIEIQKKFNEIVIPQLKQIKLLDKENRELASLRDWLLPMLMNGQVSVGEVERDYVVKDEVLGMVAEATNNNAKVVNLFNEDEREEDYYEKRKALAIYIINQSLNDVYFGDTKLFKLLHLADYHAIKRNFGQNYFQNVAGPFDGEFKNRFIKEINDEGLFTIEKPNKKYIFKKGINHKDSLLVNDYFSMTELQKVDSLITYFFSENYERPEIFSTLYAVWNNRLIKKQEVTPKLLKQDFLSWDDQKKQYEDQIFPELDTMKMLGIVPDGWGRYISKAKNKLEL